MGIKINKDLLPLKIHYFFKYGGIAFFSLLPVVCRQKGIPAAGIGLMWSVTPLSSCAINLFNSAIADAFKIYRAMFLSGLLILSGSFLSIFLLPDILVNSGELNITSNSLCFHNTSEEWSVFGDCGHADAEEWLKSADGACSIECDLSLIGISNHSRILYGPDNLNESWSHKTSGLYDSYVYENKTFMIESVKYDNDIPDIPCSSICEKFDAADTISLTDLLKTPIFWLVFLLLVLVYGGNSTSTTMADTICFTILGANRHKYGRQRMFGSLGWGLVGAISGALVDLFSKGKDNADYTPALIIAACFLSINFFVALKIPFKVPDKEKLKASRIGRALCSNTMLIYLTTVVVVGVNMGLYWTFLFIYLEDVAKMYDPDFEHMKLLQGLMLGTACFLGEVPSLFLSPLIVKKLGHINTFTLALVGFTIRIFLYSFVVNPWLFIPLELTHGASFGVFYPNMISYASLMSPKGAQATIQGIVKSLFVVGVSLGGLIGGILMTNVGGSNMYLYMGEFDMAYTVFFCIVHFIIYKMDKKAEETADPSSPELAKLRKKSLRGLASDLAVEEQGSMCDLSVITPCTHEEENDEGEKEKLKEEGA